MNKLAYSLCLAGVLALPGMAQARPVTLTTQLQSYSGDGAYLAIYVTDAAGQYKKTLWVAGKKSKYYKHLRDWARGSGMKASDSSLSPTFSITSLRWPRNEDSMACWICEVRPASVPGGLRATRFEGQAADFRAPSPVTANLQPQAVRAGGLGTLPSATSRRTFSIIIYTVLSA